MVQINLAKIVLLGLGFAGCTFPDQKIDKVSETASIRYVQRENWCYLVLSTSSGDETYKFDTSTHKRDEFISELKRHEDSCRDPDVLSIYLRFTDHNSNGVIENFEIERMKRILEGEND